jgi:carbon starvation protein CstA
MIDKVHQHIMNELQQGARTDTIFVLTAILFNLVVLAVSSGVAANAVSDKPRSSDDLVLMIFILLIITVTVISVRALSTGKKTRVTLIHGLISMYRDNQVEQYYDLSLLKNYNKRYLSFSVVIVCIGITAAAVPLAIRFI